MRAEAHEANHELVVRLEIFNLKPSMSRQFATAPTLRFCVSRQGTRWSATRRLW